MKRKDELDDVKCERALYEYLRSHMCVSHRGWATLLWERWHSARRATFIVSPKGEAIHLPSPRAALIAELRLVLLRQGYPLGFVALFDRTDN